MKKWLLLVIGLGLLVGSLPQEKSDERKDVSEVVWGREGQEVGLRIRLTPTNTPAPTLIPIRSVKWEVPFTSQAPLGEWSDPRQQDGCEEASALMAVTWARRGRIGNEPEEAILDTGEAKAEILAAYEYQMKNWGVGIDTGIADTAERIVKGYFGWDNFEVRELEGKEEIIRALMDEKVVVVAANGKRLGNPNFQNGGPDRHQLVIIGYDAQTGEFVTNDPGTRLGKGYRYDEDVLWEAIRDYPSGDHKPIVAGEVKRGIIVGY